MKLADIAVDTNAEDNGQWIVWPEYPEVSALVRSLHHPAYQDAQNALADRLRRAYGGRPTPSAVRNKEIGRLIARHLWLDIAGLTDDEGNAIVLTDEMKERVATQREYRMLMDFITWAAARVGDADAAAFEEDAGNSGNMQSGSDPGGST